MAAANALNLTFLTALITAIVAYLPFIAAFVIILIVGFIVIDWFCDFLRHLGAAQQISMIQPLITVIQAFLYFVLVILALQQLKIDLTIIYVLITPVAWGIGIGISAAIAIFCWFGMRDRAPRMMDDFVGQSRKRRRRRLRRAGRRPVTETPSLSFRDGASPVTRPRARRRRVPGNRAMHGPSGSPLIRPGDSVGGTRPRSRDDAACARVRTRPLQGIGSPSRIPPLRGLSGPPAGMNARMLRVQPRRRVSE